MDSSSSSERTSVLWTDFVQETKAVSTSTHVERPFLANLAVSKDHRRQGIATTLVQVALQQARKWKPSSTTIGNDDDDDDDQDDESSWSMFLGVSHDNEVAISLYKRLNFTLALDETNALSLKMLKRLKRSPRLYFEKNLE